MLHYFLLFNRAIVTHLKLALNSSLELNYILFVLETLSCYELQHLIANAIT